VHFRNRADEHFRKREETNCGGKWEYLVEDLQGDGKWNLDQRGEQGWELIAVTPVVMDTGRSGRRATTQSHAYFKRQKQN
jgi:hypothetical protein